MQEEKYCRHCKQKFTYDTTDLRPYFYCTCGHAHKNPEFGVYPKQPRFTKRSEKQK